jgi:atypical dual specificity phosphatase
LLLVLVFSCLQDRAEWLALAILRSGKRNKPLKCVWAVHFDVPAAVCITRVAARTDHPTIKHGRGRRAVESFAAVLEAPTADEGFERVIMVRSRAEVDALLLQLGAEGLPEFVQDPPQQVAEWQRWQQLCEEESSRQD